METTADIQLIITDSIGDQSSVESNNTQLYPANQHIFNLFVVPWIYPEIFITNTLTTFSSSPASVSLAKTKCSEIVVIKSIRCDFFQVQML